jgi:hypothetical protein
MAAPEYVPQNATTREDKAYSSPPWRTDSWFPDRPGELDLATGQQPEGTSLGVQGPDQGYAIKLANRFRGTLHLEPGEHEDDALAGALGVALRRSSLFGRAPVVHDLTIALTAFGFLDEAPDADLVAWRRFRFEEISSPNHYFESREVAHSVLESVLRLTPAQVAEQHRSNWRSLLVAT